MKVNLKLAKSFNKQTLKIIKFRPVEQVDSREFLPGIQPNLLAARSPGGQDQIHPGAEQTVPARWPVLLPRAMPGAMPQMAEIKRQIPMGFFFFMILSSAKMYDQETSVQERFKPSLDRDLT